MSSRKPTRGARSTPSTRLPYVEETKGAGGQTYLYYRRAGRRIPLPQPEHSEAFRRAYAKAEAEIEGRHLPKADSLTVELAVTEYLKSADYRELAEASRRDYRRTLDGFRAAFGEVAMSAIDEPWIEDLRTKYAPDPDAGKPGQPIAWNGLRSRMIVVTRLFRKLHPGVLPANPWEASKRLSVPKSRAHRPWPAAVLLAVLRAATPEFRALLIGYLMTAQRGGDVTAFRPAQYDPAARTLNMAQEKTDEALLIHVPDSLARVFDAMRGRVPDRLFCTPRGEAWTVGNAQETLQRLLRHLALPRYTLHGLRATGAVTLKMLGFENRAIRALTGHTSDANLEVYLAGVDHYPLAKAAQEALEGQFADLLAEAETEANTRRYAGVTGRASRKRTSEDQAGS